MKCINALLAFSAILPVFVQSQFLDPIKVAKQQSASKLPPCRLCTVFVESFKKGMERTSRGQHESGDAAWEQQNMRVYSKSVVRLVEILDNICQDLDRGEDECHAMSDEVEKLVEKWFYEEQDNEPDFHRWLCIEEQAVCCPPNHFGLECLPCSNCNGNGECKGNGTRKGNGKCSCHVGYAGEFCDRCDLHYYESFRDENKLLCSECHNSCEKSSGCRGAGPQGCIVCKNGWEMLPDRGGCIDVDECAVGNHGCGKNEFCINKDGSHECLKCDRSCEGCSGDGPDLCYKCADGYELRNGLCTDLTSERRLQWENITRYITYLGLCVATCLTFKSSMWITSIIGLAVALYISISELWLSTNPSLTHGSRSIEEFFHQMNSI